MLNLTNFNATPSQVEAGVTEISQEDRNELRELLR